MRATVNRKEYENQVCIIYRHVSQNVRLQERLSALLDRAEAVLDRFERAGDALSQHVWLNGGGGEHTVDGEELVIEQVVHDGEYIQTEDDDEGAYMIVQ